MLLDGFETLKDAVLLFATGLLAEGLHRRLLCCRVIAIAHLGSGLGKSAKRVGGVAGESACDSAERVWVWVVGIGVVGRRVVA